MNVAQHILPSGPQLRASLAISARSFSRSPELVASASVTLENRFAGIVLGNDCESVMGAERAPCSWARADVEGMLLDVGGMEVDVEGAEGWAGVFAAWEGAGAGVLVAVGACAGVPVGGC